MEEAVEEEAVEEKEAVIRIPKDTGTRSREKIGPQYTRRHRLIEKTDNRFVRDEQRLEHGGMTTPIPLSHSQQNVRDRVDRGTRCFGVGEDYAQLTGERGCLQLAGGMLSSFLRAHAYEGTLSCCPRGTDHVDLHGSLSRSTVERGQLGRHDKAWSVCLGYVNFCVAV